MSLQDLCLNHIIHDFHKYYTIFSTTENANIKRQFEFLQRKYSFKIASLLHADDELKEEYIDLVINKYLDFIDTEWFKHCSWKTISSKFAEIGSNLSKIQFHDVFIEDDDFEETPWHDIICHLPNLEVLYFQEDCHDKILESVAKYCPNILEMDLRSSCGVTNDGIKTLCLKEDGKVSCSKLKRLYVASTEVTHDGMKHLLKNMPSLELTDYKDLPMLLYTLHKDDLSSLDKVEPYKFLSLDLLSYTLTNTPFFDDILKICLSLCPNLKALSCPLLNEEQQKLFSKVCRLEKLHLENYSNSAININDILKSKGGHLTSLTVNNCNVSVPVLAKHCSRLKQLNLNRVCFIVDDDSKVLLPCLDSCIFENVTNDSSTDKAVKLLLSSSSKLESIAFKRCTTLSPDIKTQILKCCETYSLKSINLSYSTVDIFFLTDIILNCHTLKNLHLEGCDVEEDDEQELYRLSEVVPNNPAINFNEELSISDYDDFLNDYYDFEDELDEYYGDDYGDEFYLNQYDYEEEDDYDDYGYYFEL